MTNNTINFRQLSDSERVALLADEVVRCGVNLTPDYSEWLRLGFAIAHSLGAEGIDSFLKISSTYPGYNEAEARQQYQKCLSASDHSECANPCTLASLFDAAKQAGLSIPSSRKAVVSASPVVSEASSALVPDVILSEPDDGMVTFSEHVAASSLPTLLRRAVEHASSDAERDVIALGLISTVSSALPNVCGKYDRKILFPNLYYMVVGEASSGKSCLALCRHVVAPIHAKMRERYQFMMDEYQKQKREFLTDKKGSTPEPQEPGQLMLFAPANSSSTAILEHMADNPDGLLFFETEGDTVANSFKSDYGNYSDTLRKAFHHEPVSYSRRKDKEYRELDSTRLSLAVSGTPSQAARIFPNVENGLFSRFIFYYLPMTLEWRDVWADSGCSDSVDDVFRSIGQDFFSLYNSLFKRDRLVYFDLSDSQKSRSTDYFKSILPKYYEFYGKDMISPIHRLGVIFFRIAMVISVMRLFDENPEFSPAVNRLGEVMGDRLVCSDADYELAMSMVDVILHHMARIYQLLPREADSAKTPSNEDRLQAFVKKLPKEFRTADAVEIGDTFSFSRPLTQKLLSQLVERHMISRTANRGHYVKP